MREELGLFYFGAGRHYLRKSGARLYGTLLLWCVKTKESSLGRESGDMLEEKRLIWQLKHGSAEAFERIYVKHKNDLLKLAVVLVRDVQTAEDIVHDVFVHVAQTRRSMRLTGNLRSLLATAVVNRVRNARRDGKRQHDRAEAKADGCRVTSPGPEQWAIVSEQLQQLGEAMAQLPYEQREAVALHEGADMTFPQIARLQRVSVNTVQGRCRYGLQKLRSLLNSEVRP
jgi:RNA polymerase sigma factor (sigma-70 family)